MALTTNQPAFNYSALPDQTASSLRARAERIRVIQDRAIIEVGKELTEAQEELADHAGGTFQKWIEAETDFSRGTAYNLINIYKRFGSRPNFGQLPVDRSALYLLAAPSTPDEVVDQVVERAEQGEAISYTAAKEAVDAAKPAPEAPGEDSADPATQNDDVPAELRATFNQEAIALTGRTDDGAWHRAIEIARKLVAAEVWDGQTAITFDAYALHDKLFGVNPIDPFELVAGEDYDVDLSADEPDADVVLAAVRSALDRHQQQHPDSNVVTRAGLMKYVDLDIVTIDRALKDLVEAGELELAGNSSTVFKRVEAQPSTDEAPAAYQLAQQIVKALEEEGPMRYDKLRDILGIKPTDEAVQTLRAALDTLFGQQQIQKLNGGVYALVEPADSEGDADGPDPAHVDNIRTLLAGGPQPFRLLWNSSNLKIQDVRAAVQHLLDAGEIVSRAGRYALAEHEDRLAEAGEEHQFDVEALENAIIIALTGKDRVPFPKLREAIHGRTGKRYDTRFLTAALDRLRQQGRISKVGGSWDYTLTDKGKSDAEAVLDELPPTIDGEPLATVPDGTPEADEAARPFARKDRMTFERALLELIDNIETARTINGIRGWYSLGPDALKETRALIARTINRMQDAQQHLAILDVRLAEMIKTGQPYE